MSSDSTNKHGSSPFRTTLCTQGCSRDEGAVAYLRSKDQDKGLTIVLRIEAYRSNWSRT